MQDYHVGNLTWNFCKYAEWPRAQSTISDTFAFMFNDKIDVATPITNTLLPSQMKLVRDSSNNPRLQLTYVSTNMCKDSDPYTYSVLVHCDKDNVGQGQAEVMGASIK